MKTFSELASLVRAANPWLSKATCSCQSTYGIVGVEWRCPHSVSHLQYVRAIKVAGAHEYHYKPDFLLTVFLYLSAGQKLQTFTTQLFYDILTVY